MKATRFLTILFLTGAVIFLRWWFFYDHSLTGIDDANIYFVYAKNMAEGHGLVYNPGGERVEGFTSMLWVLILTVLYIAGPMEILALVLNLLLISYTLYKVTTFTALLNNSSAKKAFEPAGILILAFVLLIPGYPDWTILTLMETGLWSSLLILISLNLLKLWLRPEDKASEKQIWFLIPLLIFTRPESIAWGFLFILIRTVQIVYFGNTFKETLRKISPMAGSYIMALFLLIGFRLIYFGYPLPNTFYVKVSSHLTDNFIDGIYYLLRYVKENPFIPVFLLAYLLSFIFIIREFIRKKGSVSVISMLQLTILVIMGVHFLIPFYTGGDHFYLSRFFQPLYPLFLLGVFNTSFRKKHLSRKIKEVPSSLAILSGAGLIILMMILPRFSLLSSSPIKKEFDIALNGRNTGHELSRLFGKDDKFPAVGTYLAGGLAFAYEGPVIDLLGLNNTQIAHAPKDFKGGYKNHSTFNKTVFYQLSPDIVHINFMDKPDSLSLNESDSADFQNQVYKYIFLDKEFQSQYVPVLISASEKSRWYMGYLQEKYLETLQRENHKIYVISRKEGHGEEQNDLSLQLSHRKKK